jgi:hypothetical protein
MKTVFADTCFYIALLRPVDDLHLPSKEFDRGYHGLYLTSEYVLIELGNWFAETAQRRVFVELARRRRVENTHRFDKGNPPDVPLSLPGRGAA